jgi:uncharacterized protein (TIGR02147 family)
MAMAAIPSHLLLRRALLRLQRANKSYSLRRFAAQVGLSPSFVSEVFQGKKPLPARHFSDVCRILQLDDIASEQLRHALRDELLPAELKVSDTTSSKKPSYQELSRADFPLLSRWYFLTILDLTTCKTFRPDPKYIARRIGISVPEARQAWEILQRLGAVEEKSGNWRKCTDHLRFPTTASEPAVRAYHSQTIPLALRELQRAGKNEFDCRLITGLSVAVNPEKIQDAKRHMQKALMEVGQILTDGECTEVYQVQCQLFSVTRNNEGTT